MHKELKSAVFAVLLIAASYYFGDVCERIGQGYELILFPSEEILGLRDFQTGSKGRLGLLFRRTLLVGTNLWHRPEKPQICLGFVDLRLK